MSESDEYAIDAARFTDALREQRVARTPGGLYHLNQILMAYNSNRIEGSVLTEDQTRFIYETRTIFASGDEAVPVDDIVETSCLSRHQCRSETRSCYVSFSTTCRSSHLESRPKSRDSS